MRKTRKAAPNKRLEAIFQSEFLEDLRYWIRNDRRIAFAGSGYCRSGRQGPLSRYLAEDKGVHPDKWHQPNFIDCIRSRNPPNSDIEQGHYSSCVVHLGNLAYRAGNKHLEFDGKSERFTNNDWANGQLKPAYRKHYRIPDEV